MFQIGTKVKWVSQAGGVTKEKVGEVVRVVNPGEVPILAQLARELGAIDRYGGGGPRKRTSFVVKAAGKTDKSKPHLYWPVETLLTPIEESAAT